MISPAALSSSAEAAFQSARNPHAAVHFFLHLGLLGLFFVSAVDSSFVPLPVPGITDILIVLFAASHENVFLLVGVATLGSALGGLLSHGTGRAGGMAFLKKHVSPRILGPAASWMERHALLAVALPALLPPPMPLSPFVLLAGVSGMSRRRFMIAFTASRLVRHALAAWLGVHYGRAVLHLWNRFSAHWGKPILIGLWVVIGALTAIAAWKLWKTSRSLTLGQANQT